MKQLQNNERALLTSLEGLAAFRILLPFIRAVALDIAGRGECPPVLDVLPDLKSDVALERRRYRELNGHKQ